MNQICWVKFWNGDRSLPSIFHQLLHLDTKVEMPRFWMNRVFESQLGDSVNPLGSLPSKLQRFYCYEKEKVNLKPVILPN